MIRAALLVLPLVLMTGCVSAKGKVEGNTQKNLADTRAHYSALTSGAVPRIAELTLFTNLLPKGGDLHHHYAGSLYAETYLDWVGEQGQCVFSVTDASLKAEKFKVATRTQELSDAARAVCLGAEAVRLNDAFFRDLLKRWSDKDYGNHVHEQLPPDQQFFTTFEYFDPVTNYDYQKGLQILKGYAKAENLGYLETMLKGGPAVDTPELERILGGIDANSTDAQIEEAFGKAFDLLAGDPAVKAKLDAYLALLEASGLAVQDEEFTVRFQSYVPRHMPLPKTFGRLYTSFAADAASPWVVGINFVGPENRYVAMRDYRLHMKVFGFLKKRFPGTRVSLHAGELVLGMVPPDGLRSHIRDAVLIAGADRIGHGIDIAHESEAEGLMAVMKQRPVAVEVNLTSNEFILGVKDEAHPLRLYQQHGVPFVISTDDAGVSRNNISGEYLLYVTRYKPSYDELKDVVYNSIRYSFLSDEEKRAEIARLDRRFAAFEARVAALPTSGK